MKLDKMISAALYTSGVANGVLSLANENQERELEKIPDSANMDEIIPILDEIQPHKKQHSKHINERDIHQFASSFAKMQDTDSRHPYSAHRPAKNPVPVPEKSVHKGANSHIERTVAEFNKLKKGINNESSIRESISKINLEDYVPGIPIQTQKDRDNYLLSDYKYRVNEASKVFKEATKKMKILRKQSKKLEGVLNRMAKQPQNINPDDKNAVKAGIININNNLRIKVEAERAKLRSELTKGKISITLVEREVKRELLEVEKFINEYAKLINNFEKPINHAVVTDKSIIGSLDKSKMKIPISSQQKLSEKLASATKNNKEKKLRNPSDIKRDRAISL